MSTEIILAGNEETLKPIITMLIAVNQLLDSRDIGQFVGEPLIDNVKAVPHTLRMKLIWYSVKRPPFKPPMGAKITKAEYQIPDIDPKKLDWVTIKQIMGGSNGFMHGRFVAIANLSNGRQMQVYGASKEEANSQLDRLLLLTKAKVLSSSVTELSKEGRRAKNQPMEIEPIRVYPAFMSIVNSKRILRVENRSKIEERATKRRSKLSGDYIEKGSSRIPMYGDTPPKNFKKIITNALRIRDDD